MVAGAGFEPATFDGMKAPRLRPREDYRGRWTTLDGVSRERRRSTWNISRSMPTSITPWRRWLGRTGRLVREQRLPHERGALQQFLARCEPGSPVAVETMGLAHSSPAINERSGPEAPSPP